MGKYPSEQGTGPQTSRLFQQLFVSGASNPGFVGRKGSVASRGGGRREGGGIKREGGVGVGLGHIRSEGARKTALMTLRAC